MNLKFKKLTVPRLRWTLGFVVLIESFRLAFEPAAIQHFAGTGLPQWFHMMLAGGEIIAAILFMVPFTIIIGGYALIVIFALAAALNVEWSVCFA